MRFPANFARYVGTPPTGGVALGDDVLPAGRAPVSQDNALFCRFNNVNGWPVHRVAVAYGFTPTTPTPTTVAIGSNGTNQPSAGTVDVASTEGWPSAGTFEVDGAIVSYTGVTVSSFTGCTRASGAAALTTGDAVTFVSTVAPTLTGTMYFYEDETAQWYRIGAAGVSMAPGAVTFFDVIAILEMPNTLANLQSATPGSIAQVLLVESADGAPDGVYTFAMAPDLTTQA